MRQRAFPIRSSLAGFTLLEVMLALALVTIVLGVLGTAVHLHLRVVDAGRTRLEETQLARALLKRIADDLRGAVLHRPVDVAQLMPDASTTAATAAQLQGQGNDESSPQSSAAAAGTGWEELDQQTVDYSSNLAEATDLAPEPGLYGNAYELQVDTSRLPRIDEYGEPGTEPSPETLCPSDVKTVTYYVLGTSGSGSTSGISLEGGGLVRREMQRATAVYAAQNGQLSQYQDASPIAPEVVGIQFLYFDGTEVVDQWDSQQRGGLPMAVEVTLYIQPRGRHNQPSDNRLTAASPTVELEDLLVYRLLVHLPMAEPTSLEGGSTSSAEGTESAATGSGDAQDSGGAPNTGGTR